MVLSSTPFAESHLNLPEALPKITVPVPDKVIPAAMVHTGSDHRQFFALGGVEENRERSFNAEGNRGNNILS